MYIRYKIQYKTVKIILRAKKPFQPMREAG
jgi:hypothetical protein